MIPFWIFVAILGFFVLVAAVVDEFEMWNATLGLVIFVVMGFVIAEAFTLLKYDKTVTTISTEVICSKENEDTHSQDYFIIQKNKITSKIATTKIKGYYSNKNGVVVPKEMSEDRFVIEYTDKTPYMELIESKRETEGESVKKRSIIYFLGMEDFFDNEKYYIFYVPEGSVSDELYLKYSSGGER